MQQIAILGATASGKSDYALELAKKIDAYILSLDSLSIYKEIDIVSAKPSKDDLLKVRHFGIDEIYPNDDFNVSLFIDIYNNSYQKALQDKKNLIIVGGTSFYLKMLINGLSKKIKIDRQSIKKADEILKDIGQAYAFLQNIDKEYANKITYNDYFRIHKAIAHYIQTNQPLSDFFKQNPKHSSIKGKLKIYEIQIDKEILKKRIYQRTQKMIDLGLIDEIEYLIGKYGKEQKPFKAIGIKETILYLEGKITKNELLEKISKNTAKLAKRQRTFNKTQFLNKSIITQN